jgi:hypothetical protein
MVPEPPGDPNCSQLAYSIDSDERFRLGFACATGVDDSADEALSFAYPHFFSSSSWIFWIEKQAASQMLSHESN